MRFYKLRSNHGQRICIWRQWLCHDNMLAAMMQAERLAAPEWLSVGML